MDFLAGWVYMSGLPCTLRFFPRCAMGFAKCVATKVWLMLECGYLS